MTHTGSKWPNHILDDVVLFVWDFNEGAGKRTELTAYLSAEFERVVISEGLCAVLERSKNPGISPSPEESTVRRIEHVPSKKLTTLKKRGVNAVACGVLDMGGRADRTRIIVQIDGLDGTTLAKQSTLVSREKEKTRDFEKCARAIGDLARLAFLKGTVQDALEMPTEWMELRERPTREESLDDEDGDNENGYDFDQSSEDLFQNARWRKYEETGNVLYNLFRHRTRQELGEPAGFFGDFGNRTVADSGTAIWLCKHTPLLFREVSNRLSEKRDKGKDVELSPSKLVVDVIGILETESRFLPDKAQSALLARLMVGLGVGILEVSTDWMSVLRALFELQFESSSGSGAEKPFMKWAIGVEVDKTNLSLAQREESFNKLYLRHPIDGYYLNHWAYLLLRLGLHLSGTPMAKMAATGRNDAAALDTYGWALFLEGKYKEGEKYLSRSLRMAESGSEDWAEVQYHRVRNAIASGHIKDARAIAEEMKGKAGGSYWTDQAIKLKLLRCAEARKDYEYDVALSFAGEDRLHASRLAELLGQRGLSVFYDDYEKAEL